MWDITLRKMRTDARQEQLRTALTQARISRGLTQMEVASRLNRPQSFVSKYENGERRLDIFEFLRVCATLSIGSAEVISSLEEFNVNEELEISIFDRWGLTVDDLTELVDANPSLRGILLGYVAEKKFHEMFLMHPDVADVTKDDDHDRTNKGDRKILYRGKVFRIEIKSLQTRMVRKLDTEDTWSGKAQVDGSDKRLVKFKDGTTLQTTLLVYGEFDLLAVNCFAFGDKWRFVFAKNSDLPCSNYRAYTEEQRSSLIASLVPITWPPEPPFYDNPYIILDELISSARAEVQVVETVEPVVISEKVLEIKGES